MACIPLTQVEEVHVPLTPAIVAGAFVFQVCDHTVCEGCYRDGMCPGCWFESDTEDWKER